MMGLFSYYLGFMALQDLTLILNPLFSLTGFYHRVKPWHEVWRHITLSPNETNFRDVRKTNCDGTWL